MANQVTLEQILVKIKELIAGNPFLKKNLYNKFVNLDDERLKKALVMLYVNDQKQQEVGNEKIVEQYQAVEKNFQENVKKEMTNFIHEVENKDHQKEETEADELIKTL